MQPLTALTEPERSRLRGVLFDLDDTLLDDGRLTREAYDALWSLAEAGYPLVAVTGRPWSWGQMLLRQWPLKGVVVENGALALHATGRTQVTLDRFSPEERANRRALLEDIAARLQQEFPDLQPTDDAYGRRSDTTFDIAEHCQVEPARVSEVRHFAERLGARTITSSIHLHLTLDHDDKATGTLRFLSHCLDVSPVRARTEWAFIGDSTNDAACFAAFSVSIGVANLRGHFSLPPRFSTHGRAGDGFAEVARRLLTSSG